MPVTALRRYTPQIAGGQSSSSSPSPYSVAPSPFSGQPNPYQYQLSTTPYSNQGPQGDINAAWWNQRNTNQGQGDVFENQFGQAASNYGNLENQFGGQGYDYWSGNMAGTPGYTDAEAQQIMGTSGPYNMYDLAGAPDYQSNYLTGQEQSDITGNPYSPMNYMDQ